MGPKDFEKLENFKFKISCDKFHKLYFSKSSNIGLKN